MNKKTVTVAAFLSDYKLAISAGALDGIEVGMELNILSKKGQDIKNPLTSENLGKIQHIKTKILVIDVYDKFSICIPKQQNDQLFILKMMGNQSYYKQRFKFDGEPINREVTDELINIGDIVEI